MSKRKIRIVDGTDDELKKLFGKAELEHFLITKIIELAFLYKAGYISKEYYDKETEKLKEELTNE